MKKIEKAVSHFYVMRQPHQFSNQGNLIYSERFAEGDIVERIVFNDTLYNNLISIDLTKGGRDTIFLKDADPACYPCPN